MNKTLSLVLSAVTLVISTSAMADDRGTIESCATDSYHRERIEENVPKEERLDVYNLKGEIVGAFHMDPSALTVHALYLCGGNSGYFYADGDLKKADIERIYSDEYDVDFDTQKIGKHLKIKLHIQFTGEPEDADYGPVDETVVINLP